MRTSSSPSAGRRSRRAISRSSLALTRALGLELRNVSAERVSVGGAPEQPAMVALGLAQRLLEDAGAVRIHGGGFGGSIQALRAARPRRRLLRRHGRLVRRGCVAPLPHRERRGWLPMAVENASPAVTGTAALHRISKHSCAMRSGTACSRPKTACGHITPCWKAWVRPAPRGERAHPTCSRGHISSPHPRTAHTGWTYEPLRLERASLDLEGTIERIAAAGIANGCDEDTPSGADRIATRVMGLIMPRPSEVERAFAEQYELDGAEAPRPDWFYQLCCDARYVRTAAIAKNIGWTTPTPWGELEITINLSKSRRRIRRPSPPPELPLWAKPTPPCQLCMENEGYRRPRCGRTPMAPIRRDRTCASCPLHSAKSTGASSTARTPTSRSIASP